MATRVVRLAEEDAAWVERMSGLSKGMPFAEKVRVVLRRLESLALDKEDVRRIVREELERAVEGR